MKPTLRIAIVRSPTHQGQRLLQALSGTQQALWRVTCETESRRYSLSVGMPPQPEIHGALLLVDASEGVTLLFRRALWHAKRRGLSTMVALLVHHTSDEELFDLAEMELRDHLSTLGLAGDSLTVHRLVWGEPSQPKRIKALFESLDAEIPYFEPKASTPPQNEGQLLQILRRLAFRRNGADDIFSASLWSSLRTGKETQTPADDQWRIHSIFHQVIEGYFDDLPDLLQIARQYHQRDEWEYYYVPLDFLGFVGTWELAPFLCTFTNTEEFPYTPGEYICNGMRYWLYLFCAPILLDEFEAYRSSDILFIFPWAIQRILEEEDGSLLDSHWERHVPDEDMAEYQAAARLRYQELVERLGGAQALSLFAEKLSVRRCAELLLRCRQQRGFDSHLAELFSAQTGLPADTATVERLLASKEIEQFEVGKRYFFGRPLPDFSLEVLPEVWKQLPNRYK